jgi:hypothetical protein
MFLTRPDSTRPKNALRSRHRRTSEPAIARYLHDIPAFSSRFKARRAALRN